MEKSQYLEQQLFADLTVTNTAATAEASQFSEEDFAIILERAAHSGLGIYEIETFLNDTSFTKISHEDHKKKATDQKWFDKAFKTSRMSQKGLTYAATYKVSPKLLARDAYNDEEE